MRRCGPRFLPLDLGPWAEQARLPSVDFMVSPGLARVNSAPDYGPSDLFAGRPDALRGGRWQVGQKKLERFMNEIRRTRVPHRGHGRPSWPYTASERSK